MPQGIHPKVFTPDSSVESEAARSIVKVQDNSRNWWIGAVVFGILGLLLVVGADIAHNVNVLDLKTTFWLSVTGASMMFVSGIVSACVKERRTAGYLWLISGILLCLSTDFARAGDAIGVKSALFLDVAGACSLLTGICVLVANHYHEKRVAREKEEAAKKQVLAQEAALRHALQGPKIDPKQAKLFEAVFTNDSATCTIYLLKGGNPNIRNGLGSCPIDVALLNRDPAMALELLNDPRTALVGDHHMLQAYNGWAQGNEFTRKGWLSVIQKLAERGADLSLVLPGGKTLLHLAFEYHWPKELFRFLLNNWGGALPAVIKNGGDLSLKDRNGNNLLHMAVKYNWGSDVVQLLAKSKPELRDQTNRSKQNPAQLALKLSRSHLFLAK